MKLSKMIAGIIAGSFMLAMLIAGLTYADNEAVKILDAQGQAVGEYETLAAAYDAVQNGQTMQLQQDIDLGEGGFACNAGRSFTLDLNGKTLQGGYYAYSGYRAAVEMSNGGSLTITDSTADKKGAIINPSTSGGNGIKVGDAGTLTLEAGTIRASYTGIQSSYSNSKVIINGGSVMSHCEGQVGSWAGVSAYGDLTVGDGAVITGDRSGIRVSTQRSPSSGTITVNGGKITATGGSAVTNLGTITIMGGVFKGSEACLTSLKAGDGGDPVFNISGGWYSDKVNDSYVADGYTATDARPESERPDEGAPYTVVKKVYNLYVGGVHVNSQNQNDVLGDGSGSVKYDPETNTITLNNATIEVAKREYGNDGREYGIRMNLAAGDEMPGGTKVGGPVKIVLKGKNKIIDQETQAGMTEKYGIQNVSQVKLTLEGEGTLDIELQANDTNITQYTGIDVRNALVFSGVRTTIKMSGAQQASGINVLYSNPVNLENDAKVMIDTGNNENTGTYAYSNDRNDNKDLTVADGCYFEAISKNKAFKQVNVTDATKEMGAIINESASAEGAGVWDGTTSLETYKYVRIPAFVTLTLKWSSMDGAKPKEDMKIKLSYGENMYSAREAILNYFDVDGYGPLSYLSIITTPEPITSYTSLKELHEDDQTNEPLEKSTTLYLIKGKKITSVKATVKAPNCGTKVEVNEDPKAGSDIFGQKPVPEVVISGKECRIARRWTYFDELIDMCFWITDKEEPKLFKGTMIGGNTYYAALGIAPRFGFYFDYKDLPKVMINGKEEQWIEDLEMGGPVDDVPFIGDDPEGADYEFLVVMPGVKVEHEWDAGKIVGGKKIYTCKGCGATRAELIKTVVTTVANIPAKSMKLTWTKVSGAKSYKVAYRKKGGKWKTKKTSKTKYTIKGMKIAKYYEFKVAPVFKGGKTGEYSEVSYRFFRAVKGKAKGVKGGAKLTWSKEPKANGYIAYCSTSKQFKSYKEAELKGKNKKSYTFKGLKKGKTYYVIVRSYINKGGKKYLGITYPVKKVKAK